MRYMGSKARHAKHIAPIIMRGHDQTKPYIEPFIGGGNMMSRIGADIRIGGDVANYAVALLKAVSDGWVPPSTVSEELYCHVKNNKQDYPPEMVGFVGYSCSFGGKYFGGYCRGKDSKGNARNYAAEQVTHLVKQSRGLSGVKFYVGGYDEIDYPAGSTVYMDPPYVGTTGYASGGFDHDRFWWFCSCLSVTCRVFVSEYSAPVGWTCVWEKSVTNSLTKDTGAKRGVERLFTRTVPPGLK